VAILFEPCHSLLGRIGGWGTTGRGGVVSGVRRVGSHVGPYVSKLERQMPGRWFSSTLFWGLESEF
jgi:hypothetical protein